MPRKNTTTAHGSRRLTRVPALIASDWRTAREAARSVGADVASICLQRDGRHVVLPIVGAGVPDSFMRAIPLDDLAGRGELLNERQRTFWSDDVPNGPGRRYPLLRRAGIQSIVLTRVQGAAGLSAVLMCGWWNRRRRLSSDERRLLEAAASVAMEASYSARVVAPTQESAVYRERARIATLLHDSLSQLLLSVTLRLGWCLRRLPRDSELSSALEDIKRESQRTMKKVRGVLVGLSADHSEEADCAPRIRRLVSQFEQATGIRADLVLDGDLHIVARSRREAVINTIQEGLANITKHSHASRAGIRVVRKGHRVFLRISDNGVGPRASDLRALLRRPAHFGLRHMAARIDVLGGRLKVTRNIPTGFRVLAVIPVSSERTCLRSAS